MGICQCPIKLETFILSYAMHKIYNKNKLWTSITNDLCSEQNAKANFKKNVKRQKGTLMKREFNKAIHT